MLKKFRKTESQLASEAGQAASGKAGQAASGMAAQNADGKAGQENAVAAFQLEPDEPAPAQRAGAPTAAWLPASETQPDRAGLGLAGLFSRQRLFAFGVLLLLLALGWLLFVGPGRPALEEALVRLAESAPPTATATATTEPTMSPTSPSPTSTAIVARPTATRRLPTVTPTVMVVEVTAGPSETATLEPSPTLDLSGCVEATSITLANVGQTLCVRGIVLSTQPLAAGFIIVFSDEEAAFYWLTYDVVWTQDKDGQCLQTTGEILQLGNAPVLVFNYGNLPQPCP
jgi:hypothetical protein